MAARSIVRIMTRIDKSLARAFKVIVCEIEKEAKAAIKASPETVKSFCMATGTAQFKVVWIDNREGEPVPRDKDISPGEFAKYGHVNPHADNVAKLLDEYNGMLCITGWPMLIKTDLVSGELTTLNDW
ncbi:hypothetical protein [Pseudomonas sp. P8_250]|uniref:hypothetical protein n=1 Tax=Pseudomonas sp. P8_250 TaxID=3043446 RepID=UPI002A363705|nr:hypothetical protein [Pseudomonas sp. P8_250]MDX9668730.1 hypothetical protein [Pseudomonas sp. P8_250]